MMAKWVLIYERKWGEKKVKTNASNLIFYLIAFDKVSIIQSYPAVVRSCSLGGCWIPLARWDWWPDQPAAHPQSGDHTCIHMKNIGINDQKWNIFISVSDTGFGLGENINKNLL